MNTKNSTRNLGNSTGLILLIMGIIVIVFAIVEVVVGDKVGDKRNKKVQVTEPTLVLAGGGSVRNFLLEEDGVNVKELKNAISLAVASGSSWTLLNEAYHDDYRSANSLRKYNIVCLSASEMSQNYYSEYLEDLEGAVVVEVLLGYDQLKLYVEKGSYDDLGLKNSPKISKISTNKLTTIIDSILKKEDKFKDLYIYTTNKMSGTLDLYKKYLPDIDFEKLIDDEQAIVFYDNVDPKKIEKYKLREEGKKKDKTYDRKYLILGSRYYYPKYLGAEKTVPLKVVDEDLIEIRKPLYLYFLASGSSDKDSTDYFKIENSILRFLDTIVQGRKVRKKEIPDQQEWDTILNRKGIFYFSSASTSHDESDKTLSNVDVLSNQSKQTKRIKRIKFAEYASTDAD